MISRILSTPVLLAASISIISSAAPRAIELHTSQIPQGCAVGTGLAIQLRDFARILALEVLPVPRGPVNRYAGAIFWSRSALVKVVEIAS